MHQPKKNFYRKFLYEPFPVESHLRAALPAHRHCRATVNNLTLAPRFRNVLSVTRLCTLPVYFGEHVYHIHDCSGSAAAASGSDCLVPGQCPRQCASGSVSARSGPCFLFFSDFFFFFFSFHCRTGEVQDRR